MHWLAVIGEAEDDRFVGADGRQVQDRAGAREQKKRSTPGTSPAPTQARHWRSAAQGSVRVAYAVALIVAAGLLITGNEHFRKWL
ncbi:hypothetical protein [Mesorhizobium sp. M1322]|uniref:hypothetical protein n=1 Tax=Mesorhizobium sp. M1322 TaxID=2957081 RepID=UPI00333BA2E7